jgi:hypothetical protein
MPNSTIVALPKSLILSLIDSLHPLVLLKAGVKGFVLARKCTLKRVRPLQATHIESVQWPRMKHPFLTNTFIYK